MPITDPTKAAAAPRAKLAPIAILGQHRKDADIEAWIAKRLEQPGLFEGVTSREMRRDRLKVVLLKRELVESIADALRRSSGRDPGPRSPAESHEGWTWAAPHGQVARVPRWGEVALAERHAKGPLMPKRAAVIALVLLIAAIAAACWCIGRVVAAVRGEMGWEEA